MDSFIVGAYLVCAVLFILALGGLSSQKTAKDGNIYGVLAMILAIVSTFFEDEFNSNYVIFFPLFITGGLIGMNMALKVEMINMPQMVAALHSFVGLAATMVSFSHFLLNTDQDNLGIIETNLGVFIGAITFTGSLVAWGKLNGDIRGTPLILFGWGRHLINLVVILICVGLGVAFGLVDDVLTRSMLLLTSALLAGFVGWHLVMAIGGADMPVVVSMLNSYSGWATSASGFLLENEVLIITGALVGSSGAILSYIMCKAMNRSFFSVIAGGFGQGTSSAADQKPQEGEMKTINLESTVNLLRDSKKIIIIPGYGMAVAKCQHNIAKLTDFLIKKKKKVQFCIHPVAGRLPGHMNVLLAEADVDYNLVKEMDEVNSEFEHTDLVLVLGANDIVNPDALENPNSPIAGMPVCRAWLSKNVIVFKRGGGQGYAGIENPLFFKTNTRMFYGDAEKSIREILNSSTELGDKFSSDTSASEAEHHEVQAESNVIEIYPEPVMSLGVPKEIFPLEKRVAVTPATVKNFRKLGFSVKVETGAGTGANFSDEAYEKAGAEIVTYENVWKCEVILKVRKLDNHPDEGPEENQLGSVKCIVSYVLPSNNKEWLESLSERYPQLSYLAMDCVPRISKAQKLDSISSMANIGGYRAVLEGFQYFQKCPKPMMTAAGKLPPAQVLVIGAGVAGLSAIGYCKSLGCIVKAMDTRSAAKSDAESMGAKFVDVQFKEEGSTVSGYAKEMSEEYKKAQYELTRATCKSVDIVITTALIPGRPAPRLISEEIVNEMKPGSVIVDMAAEMGGNCALTKPNDVFITKNGVTIIGFTDLVSRMAPQSSELYANNLYHLLDNMGGASNFKVKLEDEIIGSMCVVHNGKMTWSPARPLPPVSVAKPVEPVPQARIEPDNSPSWTQKYSFLFISAILVGGFIGISYATYDSFMNLIMTFVLSVFIGYMVIWNVSPSLHTPLMSVTNAISGIIVIGAMLCLEANSGTFDEGSVLGMLSVLFASINIWGGFIVTYRMLEMFKTQLPEASKGKHN